MFMELGILNKIDQDLKNPRNNKHSLNSSEEHLEDENNYRQYNQSLIKNPLKEYKASTLDWLCGQARI